MSDIKVSALRHVYSAGTPFEKVAIDDINIEIPHGQFVGLIGHTGSGKSTFIQHLNALLKPTSGTVMVDGEDINADKVCRFTHTLVYLCRAQSHVLGAGGNIGIHRLLKKLILRVLEHKADLESHVA